MRRVGNLYARIGEHENLLLAFHEARRGKRDRHAVRRFEVDLAANIAGLAGELAEERVDWHGYRLFQIHDPKPRRIAAPAFRDRVLHHAIMQVVVPVLERVAIFDSYACRVGKGVFRAVQRARSFAARHAWFVQLDVRKYFDSIDHEVLHAQLARIFKERALLGLFGGLFDSYSTAPGKGLPIGSLASQHLANFHLAALDHFVKEELRVPGYVRYMDDFVLFGDSRAAVVERRERVGAFLMERMALELKNAGALAACRDGIAFLGMRVLPTHVLLSGRAKRRVRRKLKALVHDHGAGAIESGELARRATALLARLQHARTRGLRARWIAEFAGVEA